MAEPGSFSTILEGPVGIAPMAGHSTSGYDVTVPVQGSYALGTLHARKEGSPYLYFLPVIDFTDVINTGTKLQKVCAMPSDVSVVTKWYENRYRTNAVLRGDALRMSHYTSNTNVFPDTGISPSLESGYTFFPLGPPFDENRRLRSVLAAYAKVDQCAVQGSVELAESSETIQLLRLAKLFKLMKSPTRTLVSAFSDFRKDVRKYLRSPKHRKIMDPASAASNVWMEYRYGVRPLIGQVKTYRDLIINGFTFYANGVHRVSATEQYEWAEHPVAQTVGYQVREAYTNKLIEPIFERHFATSGIDKYTTHVYYKVSHLDDFTKRSAELGLTVNDIPSHIWETIPLSFCADWLWDVGLWLQAVKPKPGRTVLGAITTTKREAMCQSLAFKPYSVYSDVLDVHTHGGLHVETLKREAAEKLSLKITMNPKLLDLAKKADSAAIVFQRLSNPIKQLLKKRR